MRAPAPPVPAGMPAPGRPTPTSQMPRAAPPLDCLATPPRSLAKPDGSAPKRSGGARRDQEDSDHAHVHREAQRTCLAQHEERGVGEVEDRRQSHGRQQEDVTGRTRRFLGPRRSHAPGRQHQHQARPDRTTRRNRNTDDTAVLALEHLLARDRLADVAKAEVIRLVSSL